MITQLRDLQHRDGDKREESAVVKVDEGGSLVRGHLLMTREESGRGENDPVNAEEDGAFLEGGCVANRMFEAPVGKAHVGGEQGEKGQIGPAIAYHKKRGGNGQGNVGGEGEPHLAAGGVINQRHIGGVIRAGHCKHCHDFRPLFGGKPNNKNRPCREQHAGIHRGFDQAEDRGFHPVKSKGRKIHRRHAAAGEHFREVFQKLKTFVEKETRHHQAEAHEVQKRGVYVWAHRFVDALVTHLGQIHQAREDHHHTHPHEPHFAEFDFQRIGRFQFVNFGDFLRLCFHGWNGLRLRLDNGRAVQDGQLNFHRLRLRCLLGQLWQLRQMYGRPDCACGWLGC